MTSTDPTTVSFQLREDELSRVRQILVGFKKPFNLLSAAVSIVVFLPFLPFIYLIIEGRFLETPVIVGYAVLAAEHLLLFGLLVGNLRREYYRWAQQPEAKRFLQPSTLTISEKGVHVHTPLIQSSMAWSVFTKIEPSGERKHIMFWLGSTQALIVPERAFADQHEMDCFLEKAHHLQSAFIGGAMLCPGCGYDMRGAPDAGCPECGWQRADGASVGA